MQRYRFTKIGSNAIFTSILIATFGTILAGAILYSFSRLSLTYATFITSALVTPFMFLVFKGSKRFLIMVMVICLSITVNVTIDFKMHTGGAAGYIISILDFILAALYIIWFIDCLRNKNCKFVTVMPISVPAIGLIIIACVSIIPAEYPLFSVYEIIELIKLYLLFMFIVNNIKTKNEITFIVIILLACLCFEGILGVLQHRTGRPLFPTALGGPNIIDSRVSGTWQSYNDFAWYLTYVMPLTICMLFYNMKSIYKLLCIFILFVSMASLIWTNTRSGWISLIVAVICIFPFLIKKLKTKRNIINYFTAFIIILTIASPIYPRLYRKISERFTGDDRGSAESRWPQFRVALNIIKDKPILGIGINNYSEIMAEYDDTDEGLETITDSPVHNIFLHVMAELGILGFLCFALLLINLFYYPIKFVINNNDNESYIIIGLLGGIIAFLVHGMFDVASIGSKMYSFLWLYAGLVFSIMNSKKSNIPIGTGRIANV